MCTEREEEQAIFFYGEHVDEIFRRDDPFEILAAVEEEFEQPLIDLTWR